MTNTSEADKLRYSAGHKDFMAENVYLYCASEGLGAVIRALFDGPPALERRQ